MAGSSAKLASMEILEPEQHGAGVLAPVSGLSLYARERKLRDVGWTVAWAVFMAFSIVAGFVVLGQGSHINTNADLRTTEFYDMSLSCDPEVFDTAAITAGLYNSTADTTSFDRHLGESIAIWIPITVLVGVPAAAGYLYLFKNHANGMMKASIIGVLVWNGCAVLLSFFTGAFILGIIQLGCAGLLVLVLWWNRPYLPLVGQLLGVAGRALVDNARLIPAVLATKLVGLIPVIFMLVCTATASNIGQVTINPQVSGRERLPGYGTGSDIGECWLDDVATGISYKTPCCQWVPDAWPVAYMLIASITISWTMLLLMQLKLALIADLVSQWYYCPAGAFSNSTEVPSLARATRNVMTTGFGTASFAAAIIFILQTLRRMVRRAAQRNAFCALLACCIINPLLSIMEQLTRFASITAAITNKSLWESGVFITETFKRNLMQTATVWWLPDFILHVTVFSAALAWAVVPFAGAAARKVEENVALGAITAALCFVVMLLILSVMAGVLLDIVDTVYVCYVLDRDQQVVTRPELHQIYAAVAQHNGVVVENPGGELAYGAVQPNAAPAPLAMYPPGGYAPIAPPERDTQPLLAFGSTAPVAPSAAYPMPNPSGYGHPPAPYTMMSYGAVQPAPGMSYQAPPPYSSVPPGYPGAPQPPKY